MVWESNACVRYLAARYGAGRLWPEDVRRRAQADMWMDWQASTLLARHDRDILGPDPHARGRARLRGDRGGGQAARRDLADPRSAPGHPPLRRRRHAHDRRHPGRRQLLSLLTGCRSSGRSCPTSRAGTRASSAASPFTSTSWCRSPEETSHALPTVRPDRPADLGAGVRRRLGRRHPDPPGARDQDRGDRARARRRHQLDRHGALLWRWRVGAGARLAARGRRGPALPVDQGAARSVPARRHRRSGQAQHRGEPEPAALRLGRAVAAAQPDRPADRRSADRRRPGAGRGRGSRCARAHARRGPDPAHRHHRDRRYRGLPPGDRERPVRTRPRSTTTSSIRAPARTCRRPGRGATFAA